MEVLMKRMVELQQQEEECTQEEMVTRFERERSESIPTGRNLPFFIFTASHYFGSPTQLLELCLCSGGEGSST